MRFFWTFLAVACVLIPLFYSLYYFGFAVTQAGIKCFGATYSLPLHWEGRIAGMSGFMRRNFVIFRKYNALAIEIETNSGSLDFEVKAPDGFTLSPASGIYGRDASVLIDVSELKRCSVTLRMSHFNGKFRVALQ